MKTISTQDKILKAVTVIATGTAIIELAFSQFYVRLARLSAENLTGITLFGFIIFGLVTLFAVTRMGNAFRGKLFAILVSFLAAFFATACLSMLLRDEIFFKNVFYFQNYQTRTYDLLPLSARIKASVPIGGLILGTAVYYLSGLTILLVLFIPEKKQEKTKSEN